MGVYSLTLLEGYIALWRKYPENEIKIRVARPHVLSPSALLLSDYKNGFITWDEYEKRFRKEILSRLDSRHELERIAGLSKHENVRLLCYEKNPPCHRFLLMEMIEDFLTKSAKEE